MDKKLLKEIHRIHVLTYGEKALNEENILRLLGDTISEDNSKVKKVQNEFKSITRKVINMDEEYNHALLKEAVPYSVAKNYLKIKRSARTESLLVSVFSKLKSLPNAIQLDKKGYRIAFPFYMRGGEVQDKSPIEFEIDSLIQKYGFKVKDYYKGLAFDEKNKRDIKIGKVLFIVSKKNKEAEKLLNKFNTDSKRTQTKSSDEKLVVFSYHPYDIVGMSTGRDWTSCMDVIEGMNRKYVKIDIKKGSCIAYVINKEDTNIQKPLARILIKPFFKLNTKFPFFTIGRKDIILYPENMVYGQIPNEEKFLSFVEDMMEKVQKILGTYKRLGCLYPDTDIEIVQDKETILKIAKQKLMSDQELNKKEYELLPNNLKQLYIEKIIKRGGILPFLLYKDTPNDLKQFYIEKKVETKSKLKGYEYIDASDNLKQLYLKNTIEMGRYNITNQQYKDAPNNLKQLYIEKLKVGLSTQEYKDTPNYLKKLYIEKRVEKGRALYDEEYVETPDNLKQYHFELLKDNNVELPKYYAYYNDYQEYLKNNP